MTEIAPPQFGWSYNLTGKILYAKRDTRSSRVKTPMIHKTDQIDMLYMIRFDNVILSNYKNNNILFDLLEDGLIAIDPNTDKLYLTYGGFQELHNWDPVLQVMIDNHLLEKPYGIA